MRSPLRIRLKRQNMNRDICRNESFYRRKKGSQGNQLKCPDLPLVSRNINNSKFRHRKNDFLVLWSLLMSALEAALLLNEQNYNEVVSVIYIFLVITAFLLETIAQRAKRLSFGPLFVAVAQVSLLFGVQAMIAATRKIDQPIDGIAVKFLLVSKAERDMAFGNPNDPTIFDSTYVLQFLSPVYLRTLKASLFLAFVAMAICRTSLAGNAILLKKACRRSLQYLFVFASLLLLDCLLFDSAFDAQPSGPASCRDPPPVKFRRKPNLIILTIDSWRRDTVSMESMPLTLQWLEEPKPDLARVEWADHDSCAIQSDQGYVALYYGMKGLRRKELQHFKDNLEIKSWLLQAARNNGYELHKVTPYEYNFCWFIMEECDLYTRDFDTQNGVNSSQIPHVPKESVWKDGGSQVVFDGMESLLRQQSIQANRKPMIISADIQNLHHPLPYEVRPDINYSEPVISLNDLHLTYSGGLKITKENKPDIVLSLRNRVKNCLRNLDQDIASWLDRVRPFMENSILILTGDHSELLFDSDENLIWHGISNPIDLQRQVPMFMHGPADLMANLQVPKGIITCHSDVLPSILEALQGISLGTRWKEELDYDSYFKYNQKAEKDRPQGFAYSAHDSFQVVIEGKRRLHLHNEMVKKAQFLDKNVEMEQAEVNRMIQKIHRIEKLTWPGWTNYNCSSFS